MSQLSAIFDLLEQQQQRSEYAIDGDTVRRDEGPNVRLAGFDTPETSKPWSPAGQPGSDLARDVTNSILAEPGAELDVTGNADTTGKRVTGTLTRGDGTDAGEFMIRQGLATPTQWSTQEQMDAERGGLVTRSLFPHWQTNEERAIQEKRAEDSAWALDPTQLPGGVHSPNSAFKAGLNRGKDMASSMLVSAQKTAAQIFGADEWESQLTEDAAAAKLAIEANPQRVPSILDAVSDGRYGDIPTYLAERIGEQLPIMAAPVAAGAAGWMVGGPVGAAAATAAVSHPFGIGEVQQELDDAGIRAPGTALLGGALVAGLDTLSLGTTIGRFFGEGVKKEVADNLIGAVIKGFGKATGVGVISELPTEAAQEFIAIAARAYHDPTYEIFSKENIKRIAEAGIAGGVVGGVFGGSAGAVNAGFKYEKPFNLTPPPAPGDPLPNTAPTPEAPDAPVDPKQFGQQSLDLGARWYEAVPRDLEVEIPVTDDTGATYNARLNAYDTAVELQTKQDAYRTLLDCLRR